MTALTVHSGIDRVKMMIRSNTYAIGIAFDSNSKEDVVGLAIWFSRYLGEQLHVRATWTWPASRVGHYLPTSAERVDFPVGHIHVLLSAASEAEARSYALRLVDAAQVEVPDPWPPRWLQDLIERLALPTPNEWIAWPRVTVNVEKAPS